MKGQSIARFIEVTGAANIGWTEAGLIAGNDPYNASDSFRELFLIPYRKFRFHPVRKDRFYVPSWLQEERDMYSALDETRKRVKREQEEEFEIDRLVELAGNQRGGGPWVPWTQTPPKTAPSPPKTTSSPPPPKIAPPPEIFELEWDLGAGLAERITK